MVMVQSHIFVHETKVCVCLGKVEVRIFFWLISTTKKIKRNITKQKSKTDKMLPAKSILSLRDLAGGTSY